MLANPNRMPDFSCTLVCEQQIGEGTSGNVFAVKNAVDGCRYALKRVELANVPRTLTQALAECRLHSRLEHVSSIANYQYAWVEKNEQTGAPERVCMLLERLDGELYDALVQERPPSLDEQIAWGQKLLEALAVVHNAGVVPRDISPWNCFLSTREVRAASIA